MPITVEIDFEVTNTHHTHSGELRVSTTEYRLIRSTSDTLTGETWSPGQTTSSLFEATPQGDRPIEPPDATIFEQLPPELREVFFTDGDRALSFIEADVSASTKQNKVRDAIRNLLGLDVIEGARSRVKKAGSSINSRVKSQFSNADLQRSVDRIAGSIGKLRNLKRSYSRPRRNSTRSTKSGQVPNGGLKTFSRGAAATERNWSVGSNRAPRASKARTNRS